MAGYGSHSRLDSQMRASASKADVPDADFYDLPASPRESSANLWISGIILVVVVIVGVWLLWTLVV